MPNNEKENHGKKPPGKKGWGTPQIKLMIDEHGQVISATHLNGNPLDDRDHDDPKGRKIVGDAVLATENWCQWRLIGGRWR